VSSRPFWHDTSKNVVFVHSQEGGHARMGVTKSRRNNSGDVLARIRELKIDEKDVTVGTCCSMRNNVLFLAVIDSARAYSIMAGNETPQKVVEYVC
jgi:hypothetical protein